MRTTTRRWLSLLIAALTLLVAGCGLSGQAGQAGQAGQGGQPGPGATPQASTTPATTTASPTTPSSQIAPGAVALRLGQSHYGVGDSITVVIANGLQSEIFSADHRSDCTVLTIELQTSSGWQAMAPCHIETVTRFVPIAAGATLTQTLHASDGFEPANPIAWQPGTYRLVLSFFSGSAESGPPTQVISAPFTIG